MSGIDGFCHRYGVLHRASAVAQAGYGVEVRHFLDPRLPADLAQADLVFLYRVPATPQLCALLPRLQARDARLIGLVDDLIFIDDEECLPAGLAAGPERARWLEGARRYRALLDICDTVLAATRVLQEELAALGVRSRLHADSLSAAEFVLADTAYAAASGAVPADPEVIRLGYFSGTATHRQDFAAVAGGIAEAMEADSRLRLQLRGPLVLPAELAGYTARIEEAPLVDWTELPALVAAVDINLAPLAWKERFTRAKGATKFIEAAAVHVPTIASPTPAYEAAIRNNENGILAGSPEAFRDAIIMLAEDAGLRTALGHAARKTVEAEFAPNVRAAEMQNFLAAPVMASAAVRGFRRDSTPERTSGAGLDSTAALPPTLAPASVAEAAAGAQRKGAVGEREARIALEPDAFPTLPEAPVLAESPPLADGVLLVQRFRVRTLGLSRLDLNTITFDQQLCHQLQFTLRTGAGEIVADEVVQAALLPDRRYFALTMRPVTIAQEFCLEIRSRGTDSGNAVSFGLTARRADLPAARLGDRELAAPLALRAFAGWQFRAA
ncbi:MAG: glycosyltransferase [Deltaproteobacteria bacterium]